MFRSVAGSAVSPLPPLCCVTNSKAGLPLSPHRNPRRVSIRNSLGVFLYRSGYHLASFAAGVLSSNGRHLLAERWRLNLLSLPLATQGRLHCTQRYVQGISASAHRVQVTPSRKFVLTHSHALGPPRNQGQRLHALVDRPNSLTPSNNPQRGVGGHHQGLHRYALNGFLGPSSEVSA